MCNIATVKGYDDLPANVYWAMPLISCLLTFFALLLLPIAIDSATRSSVFLFERRNDHKLSTRMRKVYKSLRPVSICCGSIYVLENDVKRQYFNGIIQRTCDGILF